jgi:hypothetical protein
MARVPIKRIGYNAMIKMDERCLYGATFFLRDFSEYFRGKGMIRGQICSFLTLFLSRNVSRIRFTLEMTVSEETSGAILLL